MKQSSGGSSLNIQVSEVGGRDSGGSQFLVTVTPPASSDTTAAASTVSTPAAAVATAVTAGVTAAVTTGTTAPGTMEQLFSGGPVTVSASASTAAPAASAAPVTEADAYWAEQPAAVQALRNMPEGAAKDQLALSLANEGYSIDNEIMVQGWDPQTTMMLRQDYGYSWVPSYGQAAITVAPGVTDPFATSTYNPASPPAGSIQVSTAFAVGTVQTQYALDLQQEAAAKASATT
ncbi:MAG: hypothetical protein ABSF22_15910 [Bryobacteraceae bacterium]